MAKGKSKGQYPDDYGSLSKALPNFATPLRVDAEGDKLVPQNDMAEVATPFCEAHGCPDPLGLISPIDKPGGGTKRS